MYQSRSLAVLIVPVLGWLAGARPVAAGPAVPAQVVEAVHQARDDFAAGGARRLIVKWNTCVRQARRAQDADVAQRCLAYGIAALGLSDSGAAPDRRSSYAALTQDGMTDEMNVLLDIMSVKPRLRKSYLSLYQIWAAEGNPAAHDPGAGNGARPIPSYIPQNPPVRPVYLPAYPPPRFAPMASQPSEPPPARNSPLASGASEIPLLRHGDTLLVPVMVNDSMTLRFTIDSGASDVSFSSSAVQALMRSGALSQSDFTGKQTYTLADGSRVSNDTFRIRVLKVGDREVRNVVGSVASGDSDLLLGQSFLARFRSWSIDNQRGMLVLQ